jgi:hypothetical protein
MANTDLTRTVGTPTNVDKFTFSAWVKRCDITGNKMIFGNHSDTNNRSEFGFIGNNKLRWEYLDGGSVKASFETNRLFRDTNGFYHIVLAYDSSQGTSSNRWKLYVNGVQETSFSSTTYPNQNENSRINSNNQTLRIGSRGDGNYAFSGVMSYVALIDGTAELPTIFGETDATTGEWKIKTSITPSVAWGNNGFLILKDGNTITDSSPNSNNFSLNGGTLTKTEDCPSNVFATLNPLTIGGTAATLGNGNNSIVGGANNAEWYTASTIAPSTGKWYVEIRNDFASGQSADMIVGFTTNLVDVKNEAFPGKEPHSLGLWSSGTDVGDIKIDNSVVSNQYTGDWGSANKILGMALDLDNKKVYFSIDGVWQNSAIHHQVQVDMIFLVH